MKITINGVDKVIEKLDKLQKIEIPVMQGLKECLEEAQRIAESAYASQGENTDYSSNIEAIENGYRLVMSGEDVGFLEFGAGWGVMPDEFADQVDYEVRMGSYSDENMGLFAKTGYRYWYYQKQPYTHIDPTRGMQRALDYVRDNIEMHITKKVDEWIGK